MLDLRQRQIVGDCSTTSVTAPPITPFGHATIIQMILNFDARFWLPVNAAAGDSLFRVVQRTALPPDADGSQRVEVVNKAAIRVLAWKLWTTNRVVYEIAGPSAAEQTSASDHDQNSSAVVKPGQRCACDAAVQQGHSVRFQLSSSVSTMLIVIS